jgi:hypothetical protein
MEEEVVVTDRGCKVITPFPAEELPIATHTDRPSAFDRSTATRLRVDESNAY